MRNSLPLLLLTTLQLTGFRNDDYHSATAKTADEAKKLVETGFECICTTPEDLMLFRKRK